MNSKEDRLSTLPLSILLHILSFLPTQDAVRTMLLKKSFKTLWTLLPRLDFQDSSFPFPDEDESKDGDVSDKGSMPFFRFVHNFLLHQKSTTIDKFRVELTTMFYSDIEQRNLGHELESWINFALGKKVKVFELIFGWVEPDELSFRWPHSEFLSNSLVELRLEFLSINSLNRVRLSSLRILRLIRIEVGETVLEECIQGCPLLKELEIYNCYDLSTLRFDAVNVEKLILDISEFSFYSEYDDDFGHFIKIDCPNLKRFDFTGFADCLEIINLSSVSEVSFILGCRKPEFKEFSKFGNIVQKIVCAERVSLSCEFVTVLFHYMLKDVPQILVNWKRMQLSIWLTEKHIHGLNCLLRNSPHLEELLVDVTNWQSDFIKPIEPELGDDVLDGEDCWKSLKNITIHNIANSSYAVLVNLTELLLKKALVLENMVFHYKVKDDESAKWPCTLTSEDLAEFSLKLPKFAKASQHAKIYIMSHLK